jgi:hypothetical protein
VSLGSSGPAIERRPRSERILALAGQSSVPANVVGHWMRLFWGNKQFCGARHLRWETREAQYAVNIERRGEGVRVRFVPLWPFLSARC